MARGRTAMLVASAGVIVAGVLASGCSHVSPVSAPVYSNARPNIACFLRQDGPTTAHLQIVNRDRRRVSLLSWLLTETPAMGVRMLHDGQEIDMRDPLMSVHTRPGSASPPRTVVAAGATADGPTFDVGKYATSTAGPYWLVLFLETVATMPDGESLLSLGCEPLKLDLPIRAEK